MRLQQHSGGFTVKISARETTDWARKPGAAWPCSELSGKRLLACFDSNGLNDFALNGRSADCPADEFNACLVDHLSGKLSKDNPAWFVAVGQFANL